MCRFLAGEGDRLLDGEGDRLLDGGLFLRSGGRFLSLSLLCDRVLDLRLSFSRLSFSGAGFLSLLSLLGVETEVTAAGGTAEGYTISHPGVSRSE